MNLFTSKYAVAVLGLTLGTAVMTVGAGPAGAASTCVFSVDTLTPLDLQERGNGDEINIILDRETFGPFQFRSRSTTPVEVEATKLYVGAEMTVRLSEDDLVFNQRIGPDKEFACEAGTGTADFDGGDSLYRMTYTITEL